MPKISKVSQLILILGILLIAFIGMFMVWRGQAGATESLKQNLEQARSTQTKLTQSPPAKAADLESRIGSVEAELQTMKASFPEPDQSLEITENLFNLAKQCDLEVTDMATTLIKKRIDKVEYQVLNLEVTLEGDVASMVGFVDKVKTELPTAEITSVSLNKAETVEELDTGEVELYIYLKRMD